MFNGIAQCTYSNVSKVKYYFSSRVYKLILKQNFRIFLVDVMFWLKPVTPLQITLISKSKPFTNLLIRTKNAIAFHVSGMLLIIKSNPIKPIYSRMLTRTV